MKKYILILITGLIFSCEKKTETVLIEVEKESAWTKDIRVRDNEQYLLNSYVNQVNNNFYTYGGRYLHSIDRNGGLSSRLFGGFDNKDKRMPMNDYLFALKKDNTPNNTGYSLTIYYMNDFGYSIPMFMKNRDENFVDFGGRDALAGTSFGDINQNNQVLIPVQSRSEGSPKEFFYLIDIKVEPENTPTYLPPVLTELDFKRIGIPTNHLGDVNWSEVITKSFYNKFFISSLGGDNSVFFAIIYPDGSFRKITNLDRFYPFHFFKKGETLYAVDSNRIAISEDEGETWNIRYELTNADNLHTFFYFVVNDEVIMTKNGSIFHLIFDNEGFTTREIVNDGVDGNYITSFNVYNNQVYASTLSGLFFRDIDAFFTYKDE